MERFEQLQALLTRRCPSLETRMAEPMSRHTTFRIGGPAALMALPRTEEEAAMAVQAAYALDIAPFFLGSGSNLLVADKGYPGFVIKTSRLNRLERLDGSESNQILAGGGVPLSRIAGFAADQGLSGLEFAAGIPGSVGGAVVMNAGAYGGELSQVLQKAAYLEKHGDVRQISAGDCQLSYRHSVFSERPELMVLQAKIALTPDEPDAIRARMADLAQRRKSKQPLEYPSGGSMFKRPVGHFAAALIDQCGLKGLSVGGAQVSEKHAGFVVNRGGATCADVLALVKLVKERVLAQTGVELEMEVKVLS